MEKILKSYLRRLSNLSGNNRSILLLRLLKDQFIDLHDFDFEYGEKSFSIIEALLSGTASVDLCEEVDSHAGLSNEFSRRLRTIERRDRFLFEERGSKDLYVGWPFVRGKFVEGTPVRCPLLFLPVELEKKDQKWHLKRRPDVNLTFNKTFLLAYAFYNQTTLDEELIEAVLDDSGDSIVFRTDLYNLLKNSGVQIDFNSENFADELKFFPQKSKSQLEQEEKNGVLRLQPQAVLGIFPQAGSYLVPDYMELLDRNSDENLEIFFEKKKENFSSEFLKNRVEEEYTFTPLPMDAYQELALRKVKSGNSIVIQGPPGTGKSQLISNLICDFMARGKKVLVVCQKRAALDVVYERLRQKDLSDFVALVHDFKSDRKPIYKQVDNQIESLNVYEQKNNSLDAIHLERTFAQSSRRIDQILEELQEYREALFDESECGRSPKELYLTTDQTADHISMNLEYRSFHFEHLPQVERRFLSYYDLYERFDKRTNFWNTGPSFADFTTGDFLTIKKIIAEVDGLEDSLKGTCNQLGLPSLDFDNVYFFSQKLPEILEIELGLKDPTVYKVFQQLHDETPDESIGWLAQLERNIMTCFKSDGIEQSLKTEELGRFQEVLEAAITARKNPLKWIKWRLLSKNKTFLKRVLVANDLKRTKEAFEILVRRIDNRLNFEHVLSQIQSTVWLHNFPSGFRKIDIQDWFYLQKAGLNIYTVAQSVRSLRESINPLKFGHQNYLSAIKKLFKLCNDLVSQLVSWEKYIGLHQVRAIVLGKEKVKPLENTLKKDFDALCRYHQERRDLSSHERKVFDEIIEQSSTSKRALNSLKNSIGLAWLEHLEVKFPNLRDVSSGKVEALAEELREEIRQKRKVSKDILLLKARENTYRNVEYNRLNNRVTYRELQHQVTKKRMVWPIRKVVSEFSEELLNLLPCWMSSPETVSAIFPLEAVFDLVIFDEASQCFSERGIPAMYRGRQVVVAGDSMQLQPNDLYRAKWDDQEDEIELSVESLLDLSKYFLEEVQLQGHYRSKSLSLIDFSNQHFYTGSLRLLPHFESEQDQQPAIKYVQTDGIWEDGSNQKEADHVAQLVYDFTIKEAKKSIGIVTFNFRQQNLIYDTVEKLFQEKDLTLPNSLFIKNIENVQGDERDLILFSVGYAPDKKGILRMQFGSLNVEGGENRLNVAITRAKERIIVVASIKPSELKIDSLKNQGPKLLKAYLEYALQVSDGTWVPQIPSEEGHNLAWYLRNKLEQEFTNDRYSLKKDLPFADLSLRSDRQYLGLILTDDERYHRALTPKQIYAYQHFHLQMKGWPHMRIHSRDFWIDREEVMEKIERLRFHTEQDEG